MGTRRALSAQACSSSAVAQLPRGEEVGDSERVNMSPGDCESFNGGAGQWGPGRQQSETGSGPLVLHSRHQGSERVQGARGLAWNGARRLHWRKVGAEVGPRERQLRPDGQFAVFIVSGKQMTERKPSAGMGNAARAHIWVREEGKPLPRARGLPPPRMRQRRGFRGAGEGAEARRAPRGKTKSPPTGLGKALHTQTFNEHANICK